MKIVKTILPITLLFIVLTGCGKKLFGSIVGKGDNVIEIRELTGFNKIKMAMDGDVIYVQDSAYYVEISAQQNVLEVLTTEISAGELKIDFRKWVRRHKDITIIVHSPEIRALTISGSGNISSQQPIATNDLDLRISGSGNISLYSVATPELDASISGSGNITLGGGSVNNEKVTISGSGNIDALEVESNNSYAKISGSGSITVKVVQQLDATISGSGDIRYRGQPIVNTHISGSGAVIHL
jgi:hypothetical protein